jgi:hypothetical protein
MFGLVGKSWKRFSKDDLMKTQDMAQPLSARMYDRGGKVSVYDDGGKADGKSWNFPKRVASAAKELKAKYDVGTKQTEGLHSELGARADMNRSAQEALAGGVSAIEGPRGQNTDADKINPSARFGDKPGEKRIDTSDMLKTYDKGGKVNIHDGKHQLGILKEGERVLTEKETKKYEKHEKAEKAEKEQKDNPAEEAMEMKIYDKGGKVATPYDMITGGKKSPKVIKHHEYSKTHNGKHVVTHKHHDPSHKDETHMFDKFSDAADHMNSNPPQPEAEPAAPAAGPAGAGAPPAAMPAM